MLTNHIMIQKENITAPKTDAITPYGVVGKPSVRGALIFTIMKYIELTKGQTAIIDDEDYVELSKYNWYATLGKSTYYAARRLSRKEGGKIILMHRQLLGIKERDTLTDHKDGNGLNNQKNNLRECTNSQNISNGKSRRGSTSEFVGVHYEKERPEKTRNKRWVSVIIVEGNRKFLGYFMTDYEAALFRDMYILENDLIFPRLNILKRTL